MCDETELKSKETQNYYISFPEGMQPRLVNMPIKETNLYQILIGENELIIPLEKNDRLIIRKLNPIGEKYVQEKK